MKLYKNSLPDYFSDNDDVNCDLCKNENIKEAGFYDCQECGYDICNNCAQSSGKSV